MVYSTGKKKTVGWIRTSTLLLLGAVMLAGCSMPTPPGAEPTATLGTGEVKVEKVAKHSMGAPREQIADVSSSIEISVQAQASGTITGVLKANGASVKKGDVIAVMDSEIAAKSVSSAEASVRSAEKSLSSAKSSVASSRQQLKATIGSLETQLKDAIRDDSDTQDTLKANLESYKQQLADLDSGTSVAGSQAQYESALLQLEQAKSTLEGYSITAPTDGVLTGVDLTKGSAVTQGSQVGVVQNNGQVTIKAKLSEEYAGLARNKKELTVYYASDASATRQASILYLADQPNTTNRLYDLELSVDNSDGFFTPGTRVQVQLTTVEEENVVAVPTLSIVRDGSDTFVFVSNGSVAEKRQVKLGRLNGAYQEILEGLKTDESLITSGQHLLKDGDTVTVVS
ncbi:RND family efflux transporter MFP subunit [Paenibacillus cellulosilyticus]|uniref:RND family efflux transporter MFP subunit n=1 Tax=Paenibacillus cellulosilyticus TaxID=375489 RepID=A0A2V2Z0G0_9BACL|nr:efflux RND transporter periplasmic adaptor subunit [Paenibacillus cellulosilyticus]PWW08758.1 RND family efflux transporter MFP subunit [Paenibacillus cellulosilyticus]QKS48315.1 efflux RND transporter periplasmic adaptor subunit [Paenibacillus cellulosilyticus]